MSRLPAPGTAAPIALVATMGLALAGCDAGTTWRAHIHVVDAADRPLVGAEVRSFWFDRYEVDPLAMDIDEALRRAAEVRSERPGWGIIETRWTGATTGDAGYAEREFRTFYAGALFLPVHNLLMGRRESDPAGLYLRVYPSAGSREDAVDFLILPTEDGFAPRRVRREDGKGSVEEIVGSFETAPDSGYLSDRWVIRLRLPADAAGPR